MLWFIRSQGLSGFQHRHLPDLVALVLPEGERHIVEGKKLTFSFGLDNAEGQGPLLSAAIAAPARMASNAVTYGPWLINSLGTQHFVPK